MKKTARYLPARSFICESDRWHPDTREKYGPRFTGGISDYAEMEMFNADSLIPYNWNLMSAGHSDLEQKNPLKEYWVRNRDRENTLLVSDSGGFQIAKGTWDVQMNPPDQRFIDLRERVFKWQQKISDWAVSLDVPSLILSFPEVMEKTGIHSFDDGLRVMVDNLEYYVNNSNGQCKFLNALQGRTFEECDRCYDLVSAYNRPTNDRDYFRGWAFGGLQAYSAEAIIRRFIAFKFDGLLESTEWVHFLGRSKLYHTVLYSEFANMFPNIQMTYDSSGPFVTAARGNMYSGWSLDAQWPLKSIDIPFGPEHIGSSLSALDVLGKDCYPTKVMSKLTAGDVVCDNGRDSALDGLSYVYLMAHNLEILFEAQASAIDAWQHEQYPNLFDMPERFGNMLQDIFTQTTRESALKRLAYWAPYFTLLTNHKPSSHTQFESLFSS